MGTGEILDDNLISSRIAVGAMSAEGQEDVFGRYVVTMDDIRRGHVFNQAAYRSVDPRNNLELLFLSGTAVDNTDTTITVVDK